MSREGFASEAATLPGVALKGSDQRCYTWAAWRGNRREGKFT